ncbi:MAG: peroxiredoxin [Bacteroidota bacterium]
MPLKVGDKAPDFSLVDTDKKPRSLKEFLGKKTVLAFYPGAFTGVCQKEWCTLRDLLGAFNNLNAQVVGISVNDPFANKGFATVNNLTFPLLSDYTRQVAKAYSGVYENFAGLTGYSAAKRAVFILDANGTVKYSWVSEDPGKEPNYEEVTKALQSIA